MLSESRLFNFIDSKNGFTISFFEGQKVIHDIAIIHDVKNKGFSFFRNSVLSYLPLVNFLKPKENMGLFVDSDNPYFRLKIEMNDSGLMRTLFLPEAFDQIPAKFSGKVRLSKLFPHSPSPYTTILEITNESVNDVVNKILKDSYQLQSKVILSDTSDQSILISRLPDKNVDKVEAEDRIGLDDFINDLHNKLIDIFSQNITSEQDVHQAFEELGFSFLISKEIKFQCNCSRDRMITGIASLAHGHSIEEIFEHKETIETKCDYCKTSYLITKDEIKSLLRQ